MPSAESHLESDPTATLTVDIGGMSCDNCAAGIARRLDALPGVTEARVSYALEDARVRFDPATVAPDTIKRTIEDAGYSVRAEGHAGSDGSEAEARANQDRLRRMGVGIAASAVIMAASMGTMHLGWPDFPGRMLLIASLAAIVLVYVGRDFHRGALRAARARTTSMDTLVSLGSSVAFFYSLIVFVAGLDPNRFPVYFESTAMIITLVLVGKVLEARGKREASGAVRALLDQQPGHARVEREGAIVHVPIEAVELGDRVHVHPGERIPVDGVIVSGASHLDVALLTGESRPVAKGKDDPVHAGTINQEGAIVFVARAVGDATLLADIARLVREAQASRAPIQSTVDRIARVFVPTMITVAVLTGLVWWGFAGPRYLPDLNPIAAGLVFAAATLLISCPCAMGLATPLALVAGTGVGARRGCLIKSARALESMGNLDRVLLDKTGTLTLGRPKITRATTAPGFEAPHVLRVAASIENHSEHPLARAILSHATEAGIDPGEARNIAAEAGSGVSGDTEGCHVELGSERYLNERDIDTGALEAAANDARGQGQSSVFVAIDGRAAAHYAVGDAPDPSARGALERLRRLGMKLTMLTGDERASAEAIAASLALATGEVISDVLPADKAAIVAARKEAGERVAMVGDGLNDAPALATADVGVAIGSGTDVAIEAADVVLVRDDLSAVADAVVLSRETLKTIRQNLFWAFGYNVAAVPLAAGVFVPFFGPGMRLSPGIAALAMALSSLFVVTNSARLRRFDPSVERD